jgi:hypothetical protein
MTASYPAGRIIKAKGDKTGNAPSHQSFCLGETFMGGPQGEVATRQDLGVWLLPRVGVKNWCDELRGTRVPEQARPRPRASMFRRGSPSWATGSGRNRAQCKPRHGGAQSARGGPPSRVSPTDTSALGPILA